MTDFDTITTRSQSSEKWNKEAMLEHFGRDDLLPFWVADMEFQAPPQVRDCLVKRAERGIYGYELTRGNLCDAISGWYEKRHNWPIHRPDLLCFSPGIMNAIAVLINLHTEEGDGVIIQPPVFFDFRKAILNNKRRAVKNNLIEENGEYRMDFDDLEKKAANKRNRMLILCSPHNPVGRVWRRDELERVAEICFTHDVLVVSDEIHADIVYQGHRHIPFPALSEDAAQKSIACLSPAKTFNIASVTNSIVVIHNEHWRKQYRDMAERYYLARVNAFCSVAMETAYLAGDPWLDELLVYLQHNLDYLRQQLEQRIPEVKLVPTEGTFLSWLDFRELGMTPEELEVFLVEKAGLALNAGHWFGKNGAGFARFNIACPRSMLEQGLNRLETAVRGQ